MDTDALELKLKHISDLEEQYDVAGVSFAVKDASATVLTEESVDFVIAAIKAGVKDLARFDKIPMSKSTAAR